jgi:site-specific recombinase XerD
LRHAFGASAANNLVVLTLIQKWLGHAKLETTEHYTHLVGREERLLAKRTWREVSSVFPNSPPAVSP